MTTSHPEAQDTAAVAPAPESPDRKRPSVGQRRFGYLVAVVVNVVLVILVNVTPGWQAVPFLTGATMDVLPLLNLSLVAGIVANLAYVVADGVTKAIGDVVTTGIALAVLIRLWQVYPFDLSGVWATVVPWVIGFGTVMTAVALLVQVVQLGRRLLDP